MVLLLALDTSTTAITVALHDGTRVLAETSRLDARGHSEHLAPEVEQVLAEAGALPADLSDVVCGLGPGPFTGLRVGIVTARTLALATGATLHGLCSLDALAHQAFAEGATGDLVVATDARRKEVYWASYAAGSAGLPARTEGPQVSAPAELPAWVAERRAIGRGPVLYPDDFGAAGAPLDVSARWLADLVARRLAAGDPVDEHEAYYLRRPDAAPASERKAALG